jgi:putative glutamine amidotransferase
MNKSITVGVTRTIASDVNFQMYIDFLYRFDQTIRIRVLSPRDTNSAEVGQCDGIMLTGGDDVHPARYGRQDLLPVVQKPDEARDAFEFSVVERALRKGTSILGICRGLQVMNVFLGGTLHGDLEQAGFRRHSSTVGVACEHRIHTVTGTQLEQQVVALQGTVNSYHHQAADQTAPSLTVSALSPDRVVEALEWKDPLGKGFLLLVQWHPERMTEEKNPFMRRVGAAFLQSMNT